MNLKAHMLLEPGDGSAVLANMSARPRTEVLRRVPALRSVWRSFSDTLLPRTLSDAERHALDVYWKSLGITGMILALPATPARLAGVNSKPCTDTKLLLNVILRTRGNLLLAETPLLAKLPARVGAAWLIDDSRITEVAS